MRQVLLILLILLLRPFLQRMPVDLPKCREQHGTVGWLGVLVQDYLQILLRKIAPLLDLRDRQFLRRFLLLGLRLPVATQPGGARLSGCNNRAKEGQPLASRFQEIEPRRRWLFRRLRHTWPPISVSCEADGHLYI